MHVLFTVFVSGHEMILSHVPRKLLNIGDAMGRKTHNVIVYRAIFQGNRGIGDIQCNNIKPYRFILDTTQGTGQSQGVNKMVIWASWRFKSPRTLLFDLLFVQANKTANTPQYYLIVRIMPGEWIPSQRLVTWNICPLMTPSLYTNWT